jgi:uncharacterized protein (DUF488 family)
MRKQIWTIGHSTKSINEFMEMISTFNIEILADVRSYPGSKRFPHFNKPDLKEALNNKGIEYIHLPELGGRRKVKADSKNTAWKNEAFRGYADHMESEDFSRGIAILKELAESKATAMMCSEAVWWRCHRSLISDYLKAKGWKVIHILEENKSQEHPYTSPAKVVQGNLDYGE